MKILFFIYCCLNTWIQNPRKWRHKSLFIRLNRIWLYVYITFYLSIYLLMNTYVISTLWLSNLNFLETTNTHSVHCTKRRWLCFRLKGKVHPSKISQLHPRHQAAGQPHSDEHKNTQPTEREEADLQPTPWSERGPIISHTKVTATLKMERLCSWTTQKCLQWFRFRLPS